MGSRHSLPTLGAVGSVLAAISKRKVVVDENKFEYLIIISFIVITTSIYIAGQIACNQNSYCSI
jgi:hypothetical protein